MQIRNSLKVDESEIHIGYRKYVLSVFRNETYRSAFERGYDQRGKTRLFMVMKKNTFVLT